VCAGVGAFEHYRTGARRKRPTFVGPVAGYVNCRGGPSVERTCRECEGSVQIKRCGAAANVQHLAALINRNVVERLRGRGPSNGLACCSAVEIYRTSTRCKRTAVVGPVAADIHCAAVALKNGARVDLNIFEVAAADEGAALYTQQPAYG